MWEEAEGFLAKDKYLGSLVKKYGSCKIKPRPKNYYFEDLVDSIVQQQLSMKAAASIFNRIKEKISDKDDSKNPDKLPEEEIMRELVEVKGTGVWTAHMFLMFTLARPDIFPVGDLGLRNAFKKVIEKDLNNKMEEFALRWKPFRTIASWYLWRSLENSA